VEPVGGSQVLEEARRAAFARPPVRKVTGPIVDVHTHVSRRQVAELIAAADTYGVRTLLGICSLDEGLRLRDLYPGRFAFAVWLAWDHWDDPVRFAEENLALLARAAAEGIRVVKLWFAPRIYDHRKGLHLDAPLLDPVFDAIAGHRLNVLVHVADPDTWFATRYLDVRRYGTKIGQYPQLERRLFRYRQVRFLAPHMGGHPEDLRHLAALLDRHPNLSLDTGATKWIVRELGRQRDAARVFFARYADRILFGTDQVVLDEPDHAHYAVRYWIHQMFWETDLVCELPIEDLDAAGTPVLHGLDLPPDVLGKIYWENALRWLDPAGTPPAPTGRPTGDSARA
jgi:predicted TIM-barrel fold metal-dependent hydrolase